MDNVEKYCRTRQATGDNMWRMRIEWWMPKATNIHLEYLIFIDLHCNIGYTNASLLRIRTLPI